MRIVFDTNTLVSAVLIRNSNSAKVLDIVIKRDIILASQQTITELTSVLLRSKFDKYVALKIRQDFIAAYLKTIKLIKVESIVSVCKDSSDNKFLELSVDGKANYLVTGDNDLLQIKIYQNIPILNSSEFLKIIQETF